MKDFLDFLYNHDYPNHIKITFDKDFGSESEVKEIVYRLKSRKIITSENTRNTDIVVIIDKPELYKLIREFNYNLDDYDMSKKPITNNTINVHGNANNSQFNQGSDFSGFPNIQDVTQEPKQKAPEKKTIWSNIPEWAKILGGIGAIASLIKVVIELNKP